MRQSQLLARSKPQQCFRSFARNVATHARTSLEEHTDVADRRRMFRVHMQFFFFLSG